MWSLAWSVAARATWSDWLLLAAALLLLLHVAGTWRYDAWVRRGVPSSRPRLPFLGDAGRAFLGLKPVPDSVRDNYAAGRGHAVYGVFQFTVPVLMVRHPDVIKAVTVKQFDNFMNHRKIVPEDADPVFAKNLLFLQGEHWREMRKTLSPAFTSSKIKAMFPLILECTQQMTMNLRDRWNSKSKGAEEQPQDVDMKDLFTRLANDAIATAAFGLHCDSLKEPDNTFYRMGKILSTIPIRRLIGMAGWVIAPRLMKMLKVPLLEPNAVSFFSKLVKETISEREKKNIIRPDMLHLLMQAREGELNVDEQDEHEAEKIDAAKRKLTDEDIIAQAVIFFFAGFETVSTILCFSCLTISHHPEVQERLQREIDEAIEAKGGKLTYESVQDMKYLDMVISETLRLYPALSASDRVCTADCTLPAAGATGPVRVRKGDLLLLPVFAVQRDPEHWPEPQRFDPQRFSDENRHRIRPFTYMPFGLGPRSCIGQRLALLEVKLTLVNLLANFNLQPSGKTLMPVQFEKGLNMRVKGGFWCKLSPRNA